MKIKLNKKIVSTVLLITLMLAMTVMLTGCTTEGAQDGLMGVFSGLLMAVGGLLMSILGAIASVIFGIITILTGIFTLIFDAVMSIGG